MTRRIAIPALVLLILMGTLTATGPAHAFCIDNKSPYNLRVHLETPNPFGSFRVLFRAGQKGCCDWFSQRCNPTRERDGMLEFSVRTQTEVKTKRYCATGWIRRVYATADGSILITENKGNIGGLKCDSRDFFNRPVTQQMYFQRKKRGGMPPPIVVPPPPQ